MLGAALIRDLKAAVERSAPRSSARKWTPCRAVNSTSPGHSLTKIASSSSKSVFLHDWWLINADGKGLALGGFTFVNERVTLFGSAVIMKRHDAVTLETKDAMTILISGNINRQYTLENGFSTEILNRFKIGFPCDWEEYASESRKPTDKPSSCSGSNNLLKSLDEIPVGNIRDFMSSLSMNETELLMKNMYEDLQKQVGKTPERASTGSKNQGTTKATSCNVGVDDDEIQSKAEAVEEEQKTGKNLNAAAKRRLVYTRSMARAKTLRKRLV